MLAGMSRFVERCLSSLPDGDCCIWGILKRRVAITEGLHASYFFHASSRRCNSSGVELFSSMPVVIYVISIILRWSLSNLSIWSLWLVSKVLGMAWSGVWLDRGGVVGGGVGILSRSGGWLFVAAVRTSEDLLLWNVPSDLWDSCTRSLVGVFLGVEIFKGSGLVFGRLTSWRSG